jgi:hypothetical protein
MVSRKKHYFSTIEPTGFPEAAAAPFLPLSPLSRLYRGLYRALGGASLWRGADNNRNKARSPWYFAAGRLSSNPHMIARPERSQTCHSHRDRPRLVRTTSNIASEPPQHCVRIFPTT